jgi:carboxypeptidase family protein
MSRRANQIISVVLLTVAVCCATLTRAVDCSGQTIQNGKVRGSVFDPNEALIPKAKFIIEGRDFRREVSSNDVGEFEAEVPAGIYRITSEQGAYYPLKRASFRVAPDSVTVLNIRPALRVTSIALVVTEKGARDRVTYKRPPKYEVFQPTPGSGSLDLVVQFQKRSDKGDVVNFRNASLSYDSLFIYADFLYLEKSTFRISAHGNVLVEDNGRSVRGEKLNMVFRNGLAQWSMDP